MLEHSSISIVLHKKTKKIFIISWLDNSTLKHLRFPFSFFLMPVFLFALSQSVSVHWNTAVLAFVILHLFIFPSSNGYNSYEDRDETSIGGLKHPPKITKNLFYATLMLDIIAVLCAFIISIYFVLCVTTFVLVSRAYSFRKIRLKKYPFIGFLTVFIFQGAFVYLMTSCAIGPFSILSFFNANNILCMSVASLFIGSIYPLTQIYQHEADKKDGVISISFKLGYIGTFVFSAILFSIATVLLFYYFDIKHQEIALVLFLIIMVPVVAKLTIWFSKVRKDKRNANYENTMSMNLLTSLCMNFYFMIILLNNHFTWF
jgi:1,4-dihydroxy-2-naphthoate polyprenyltransferase